MALDATSSPRSHEAPRGLVRLNISFKLATRLTRSGVRFDRRQTSARIALEFLGRITSRTPVHPTRLLRVQ